MNNPNPEDGKFNLAGRSMAKLLEKTFEQASQLSESDPNLIAEWLLREIESDRKWDRLFQNSQDVLAQLADEANLDYRHGSTKPC